MSYVFENDCSINGVLFAALAWNQKSNRRKVLFEKHVDIKNKIKIKLPEKLLKGTHEYIWTITPNGTFRVINGSKTYGHWSLAYKHKKGVRLIWLGGTINNLKVPGTWTFDDASGHFHPQMPMGPSHCRSYSLKSLQKVWNKRFKQIDLGLKRRKIHSVVNGDWVFRDY